MITGLNCTTLVVRDLETAIECYRHILERPPLFRLATDGVQGAVFATGNSLLRIVSPVGAGGHGELAQAHLEHGEGLFEMTFGVENVGLTYRRLKRLSLSPDPVSEVSEHDNDGALRYRYRRTGLPAEHSHGIPISLSDMTAREQASTAQQSAILGIDLLVVATNEPERAIALYGARLGLPLIFDRTNPTDNARLLQFSCGDKVVEVVHRPGNGKVGSDRIWGIGWRVADIDLVHDGFKRAGRNVSDVRVGAKPNTRVFTLRDGTCNVATLVVQHITAP